MPKKVVDPRYAKGKEYRQVINTIAEEAKCPFCPDNFKYHKEPVLKKTGSWFITKNSWPYKNTQYHFIVLSTRHKERFEQLAAADWQAMTTLVKWAIKEYKLAGGAFGLRFGDTSHTGASVVHIHGHLIVPKVPTGKKTQPVLFPIG